MEKVKIAICIGEKEYQERLIKCMLNHYGERYEIHAYTDLAEIRNEKEDTYEAILVDEIEEAKKVSNMVAIHDYPEVRQIIDEIEKLAGNKHQGFHERDKANTGCKMIGIYSLTNVLAQLPLATTLAAILGERGKTLLIDLQEYSNLCEDEALGLEDLMAIAMTGDFTKKRWLSLCEIFYYILE